MIRPSSAQRVSRHWFWTGFAKHGDVIVCATTACLRARLRAAPIRSRERQRADAQLLMTFCLINRPFPGIGQSPIPAGPVLLAVIARHPEAVEDVLSKAS